MSNLSWVRNYIGIEFKALGRHRQSGVDCWGLIRLVYKDRFNIDLPECLGGYEGTSRDHGKDISKVIEEEASFWNPVEFGQEKEGDVIVFKMSKLCMHVGVVVSKKEMLHIQEGSNSVKESYTSLKWRNRIDGFYRHDKNRC